MLRSSTVDRPQWSHAVWFRPASRISRRHGATRALVACLAAAALAAPAALADELRSPDARTAATPPQKRADAFTGGVRAPEWLAPDPAHATASSPTTRARTPDTTPAVVKVAPAQGFDWTSAAIGAGGAIALALIAIAATPTAGGRSRPTPH